MSDTNPLPAQTLLALADAVADPDITAPERHTAAAAYRAARAASPVTLEEALMIEHHNSFVAYFNCIPCEGFHSPCARHNAAKDALEEHARRLAGEGGA